MNKIVTVDRGTKHPTVRVRKKFGQPSRVVYASKKGGKPMMIGMNHAKRVARAADKRDQLSVLKTLGPGLPRQHENHQRLVLSRHRYYHDQHEEFVRGQQAAA